MRVGPFRPGEAAAAESGTSKLDGEDEQLMESIVTPVVPGAVADELPDVAALHQEEPAQGRHEDDWAAEEDQEPAQSMSQKDLHAAGEDQVAEEDKAHEKTREDDSQVVLLNMSLETAIHSGDTVQARRLLEERANIENPNTFGRTPLQEAAGNGHVELVKMLLDRGANIEAQGEEGLVFISHLVFRATPSERAAFYGRLDVFKILRERGASVSVKSLTFLLRGEGPGYTQVVESLLEEASAKLGQARLREHLRVLLMPAALLEEPGRIFVNAAQSVKEQNLLHAAEVSASLWRMPFWAPEVCDRTVLAAVAETANEETVSTDTVDTLISTAWLLMRASTATDIFLGMGSVTCLCLVTYAYRYGGVDALPALWIMGTIHTKEAVEWASQAASFFWGRCCGVVSASLGLESLADLLYIVAGYMAIARQMEQEQDLEQVFLPLFSAMSWLRLMYSLRGERWLGPRLLPILSAVRDTWAFFLVTVLCLAAATHAYFILNPRGEDPLPIYSSFTQTVRLGIFGDFDLFEYQGQDTTFAVGDSGEWEPNDPAPEDLGLFSYMYLQVVFFVTGVGITILLMNLLIGVLGQNYEIHTDRAQVLFVRARARMLLEHRGRPWAKLSRKLAAWAKEAKEKKEAKESQEGSNSEKHDVLAPVSSFHWGMGMVALLSMLPIMFIIGAQSWDAVLGPVRLALMGHRSLAFLMFLLSPVVLALSLAVALPMMLLALGLSLMGFQLSGLQYALNLTVFGVFGANPASECTIFAMVRTESGVDELRGMRSDLKDKMLRLEEVLQKQHKDHQESLAEHKGTIRSLEEKVDKLLALLADRP